MIAPRLCRIVSLPGQLVVKRCNKNNEALLHVCTTKIKETTCTHIFE